LAKSHPKRGRQDEKQEKHHRAGNIGVYRPTPFEKLKDLPPGKKVIPQPDAKRFLLVSNTKLSLYDYDFDLMHEIDGKFDAKTSLTITYMQSAPARWRARVPSKTSEKLGRKT